MNIAAGYSAEYLAWLRTDRSTPGPYPWKRETAPDLFGGLPEVSLWTRYPHSDTGKASYELTGANIWVEWCGHPTALRPYTVRLPDGSTLDVYGNGSGPGFTTFRSVAEAKAAAIAWRERREP